MFDLDKWQEILGTIKKNKLRTFLTAFSVAWGIFILIVLLATGQGLRNGAQAQFGNDAANSIWIDGGETSMAYDGYKTGRKIQLKNSDFYYVKNNVEGVEYASAVYNGRAGMTLSYKNERAGYTVRSCAPDHNQLEKAKIVKGRFINQNDFNEYRKVCVIGIPVEQTLFKGEESLGKFIDISGTKFEVVGVFSDPGKGDNDRAYIPLLTAQRIYNGQDKIGMMWISTGSVSAEYSEQMEQNIRQFLAKKHHFNPDDMNTIGIFNNNIEYWRIMNMLDGVSWFVFIIGVFTLIAGVVGVSNIMMIVVKERTKEIGVRKALGATPWSVISLILQESVFITFIAGYIGLILGVGTIELVKYFKLEGDFFKNPEVDISVAITAVILIIIAGALAGFLPALRASKVEPIVALRDE